MKNQITTILLLTVSPILVFGCGRISPPQDQQVPFENIVNLNYSSDRSVRLALWLAKKDELIEHQNASYDLVMAGWFEPSEEKTISTRNPSTKILAGLSSTWILDDPQWQSLLLTVANKGELNGPLQITDDMFLILDENDDGILDRRCSPPGWENIFAMDPRHPGWRRLIQSFYETIAGQEQHDGVIVDMVDAYPFCEGAWSGGNTNPIDKAAWVTGQDELLGLIRERVPASKWMVANAGHGFDSASPFPKHLNGFVLENFLGSWGASLEEGLASAQLALDTTQAPHIVVFAVDTDDTGNINWARFRTGFVASLLMDHTYFAFDHGSRDHGGVTKWWFPEYYEIDLGNPLNEYIYSEGVYRRNFEKGVVVIATDKDVPVAFDHPHVDITTGQTGTAFIVPREDAGIFFRVAES